MKTKLLIINFLLLVILFSCKNSSQTKDESAAFPEDTVKEASKVKLLVLKSGNFDKEIISNGKLAAKQSSDLFFKTYDYTIVSIKVKNGDVVQEGQLIAKLDDFVLRNTFKQQQDQMERAKLEFSDLLFSLGYNANDTAKIPKNVIKMARTKSGYNSAIANFEKASYDLQCCELRAPINGIIANLSTRENNLPSREKFCTILNNSIFEATFPILESDISSIKNGQKVTIESFSNPDNKIIGSIEEINPVVDANGMVQIKAIMSNPPATFFEGMNVKIKIANSVPNQLVIPKTALVLRSERQVVFTYSAKYSIAKWNYVKTTMENSTSFAIEQGDIKAGDTVIVEGNMNLAHESKVMKE